MKSYIINEEDADKILAKKNHAFAFPFHYPEGQPMMAHRVWRPNSAFWNPNYGVNYVLKNKTDNEMHQDWEEWHGRQKDED